jgi:hypothetical protein
MKVVRVAQPPPGVGPDGLPFRCLQAVADAVASEQLVTPMLLSWYDAIHEVESPRGVSECSDAPADHGVRRYAAARGASLAVEVGSPPACSVFCYLDLDS